MHAAIDSTTAPVRMHIDALDPPEARVTPITPFIDHQELADDDLQGPLREFGNEVEASSGRFEHCQSPTSKPLPIQGAAFRFHGHGCAKVHELVHVVRTSEAHDELIESGHRGDLGLCAISWLRYAQSPQPA